MIVVKESDLNYNPNQKKVECDVVKTNITTLRNGNYKVTKRKSIKSVEETQLWLQS